MRISTKKFLITILMAALSLILLFSVSCSVDDKTGDGGSHSKEELVGTWKDSIVSNWNTQYAKDERRELLSVSNNGDVVHNLQFYVYRGETYIWSSYFGKLPDTFDYPLTIEVKVTNMFKQNMDNTNILYV